MSEIMDKNIEFFKKHEGTTFYVGGKSAELADLNGMIGFIWNKVLFGTIRIPSNKAWKSFDQIKDACLETFQIKWG